MALDMSLHTPRLALHPWHPAHLLALIDHPVTFESATALRAADGLRAFFVSGDTAPDWLPALRRSTAPDPWRHGFAVVDPRTSRVIGSAGFTGPPDTDGTVEIGYGIVPSEQGRGYATEVARALVAFAAADGRVRLVRAHTLPARNASTRVLEKCGFRHIGTIVDPHDGPVWRWERGVEDSTDRAAGATSR
jgi:ribosomal-protein-alanine N-acetyltransferase